MLIVVTFSQFLERARYHGIGRKDPETVVSIGLKDVQAASDFLGGKQFMMGDEMTAVCRCQLITEYKTKMIIW